MMRIEYYDIQNIADDITECCQHMQKLSIMFGELARALNSSWNESDDPVDKNIFDDAKKPPEIDPRIKNVCARAHVWSLRELSQCSEWDLRGIKACGDVTVRAIKELLAKYNLELRPEFARIRNTLNENNNRRFKIDPTEKKR